MSWTNIQNEEKFESKNATDCDTKSYFSIVPKGRWEGTWGSQLNNLIVPKKSQSPGQCFGFFSVVD